jgi:hypothetical protein
MNFGNLKMKESESLDQYMTHVMNIVNQLRINDEEILHQRVVDKVLRTLPQKFDAMVISIEESEDLTQLLADELLGSLLSHEFKMNIYDNSLENDFKYQVSISRDGGRSNSRGMGHKQHI